MFGYTFVKKKDIPFLRIVETSQFEGINEKRLTLGFNSDYTDFFILDRDSKPIQLIHFNVKEFEWLRERIDEMIEKRAQQNGL